MKQKDVLALTNDQLLPAFNKERQRLDRIDRWLRWDPEQPRLPRNTDREIKALQKLANTPWLNLVVTTVAQMLYCERIYSGDRPADELKAMWKPWQRNNMLVKQIALHRAALGYGLAYTGVLSGVGGARISGISPRDGLAVYGDPAEDEFPMYFIRVTTQPDGRMIRVYDEEHEYFMSTEKGVLTYLEPRPHGSEVTPFVRYANQLDLEGRAPGDIEPLIPSAQRLNKTDYDRLLVQHFNSWKIRTATGLEDPADDEAAANIKLLLRQQDILTGGEGVQFGTLDETSLEGFIKAHDSDLESLAATSQTPTTAFGKLINVSADGLVEARASLYAKRDERQMTFGSSHVTTLRLAAHVEGRHDDAEDFSVHAGWANTESSTMSQAVDALGKAAQMLGVPPRMLWDKIPGIDWETAESWRIHAAANPSADERLADAVARQTEPPE
jgi:hypothetical protein